MKHATRDSWTTERPARLCGAADICLAWLLLLALWHRPLHAEPLHATAAHVLSGPGAGYAPPPHAVDAAGPAGQWTPVPLPHLLPRPLVLPAGSAKPDTTVTWYRVHVPPAPHPRFLYVPRWKTDGQLAIYGDGRLLYQSQAGTNWNGWNIPLWVGLDATAGPRPLRTLLLRIEHPVTTGGGISTLWIGSEKQIRWRYQIRRFLQVQLPEACSAAFLSVGLFSLFLWMRLRGDVMYGLFFCIATASFLRTLHYYVGDQTLLIPESWFSWVTINALYWMVLVMHFFLNHLHGRVTPWLDRAVVLGISGVAIVTVPDLVPGLDVYRVSPVAYAALLLLGIVLGSVGLKKSWRSGSGTGMLLSTWGVGGMLLGIFDWLLQINYVSPEAIYLGPYTNIGAFLIFMYILYDRYLEANAAVKRANASLQLRLAERTHELEASHARLRDIERQQTLNEERRRLMQDMHDGMGSSLVSALMVVESGRIDHTMVADVLRDCIDDLRLTIDSMEPVQADLLLLLATLRFRLGQRFEQAGIALQWQVTTLPELEWLDHHSSLHVLRILQESFANIIKHARATEITVRTRVDENDVLVIVSDNGRGFSPTEGSGARGKGIANQERRATAIGASLEWCATGTGTMLTMRLPIHRNAKGSPDRIQSTVDASDAVLPRR